GLGDAIREANGGKRVDVVLEMAGGRGFDEGLSVLAPFGRLVAYGIASREQNTITSGQLMRGSQSGVGVWLVPWLGLEARGREPREDMFGRAARGELKPLVGETYPMSEIRRAHEDLAARRTSGKLMLDPSA